MGQGLYQQHKSVSVGKKYTVDNSYLNQMHKDILLEYATTFETPYTLVSVHRCLTVNVLVPMIYIKNK